MKKRTPQIILIASMGISLFFSSCGKKEEPKVQSPPTESLGREMGATMNGAINQAKEVRDELSQRAQQALDEMQGEEKKKRTRSKYSKDKQVVINNHAVLSITRGRESLKRDL